MKTAGAENPPVVVVSGHITALGIIRALGRMGVSLVNVYYQKSDIGYVSKYVRQRLHAPHPEKHETEFVNVLIDLSKKTGRALLVAADDAALSVISRNKPLLEKCYLVACPEWRVTGRIIDKKYTYELAERLGIAAPRTVTLKSERDLESPRTDISFPCLVKPRQSHRYHEAFGRKMVKVEDLSEMVDRCREAWAAGIDVMMQEYIPGDDTDGVNYNSYFWQGTPLIEFTASKVRLSPSEFGVPSVVMSREIKEVYEPGRKLLRALGFQGFSCVEFKRDSHDGSYKLLEVNGRHNRSCHLAIACGINFPWIEYEHLVNGKLPNSIDYVKDVYWIDEFGDMARFAKSLKHEPSQCAHYAKPYVRKHVFATFDLRDARPFLKRCFDLLGMAFQRAWEACKRKPSDAPRVATQHHAGPVERRAA
jgi:D-aspartate ligase